MSTDILKQFGLSDNEAKVYLALLELGKATILEIARKSQVKRTTIYALIGELKEKGLATETKKGVKTYFLAESPDNLLAFSEKRHKMLEQALPELKSIYNVGGEKPKVRFYEGKDGYSTVYKNILKDEPKELLVIASYENWLKHIDWEFEEEWTKERIAMGIKLRWLDFKTKKVEERAKEGKEGSREIRFLPKDFPFTSNMFIYEGKIIIMSGRAKEFMAVVVENSEFSQMFKQLFEMLWGNQKPR